MGILEEIGEAIGDALKHAWGAITSLFSSKPVGAPTQPCPAAPSRCLGIGLSSDANAKEFVKDFKKLQSDWSKLTVAEREQQIEEITNKQLKKSGVPPVAVVTEKLPKGNNGNLNFFQWQLALNQDMLNSDTLSDDNGKVLANAAYHESRHAEQWYLMAQKRAADGRDATAIRDEMSLPANVAAKAQKSPLAKGSGEEKCACELYDSVYGKNAAARAQTLKDVMSKLQSLNTANESHVRDFNKTYKDYRNLPEEADAFESGEKIDKNW